MDSVSVNYTAVVVAAVVNMVLGFLWYSPMLFAKQWMELSGISAKDMEAKKSGMNKTYVLMFVGALVTMYVLSMFVHFTGANTYMTGAKTGFWAWLGFVAPMMLSGMLFEGQPFKLYAIKTGYHLVSLLVAGAILATWMY